MKRRITVIGSGGFGTAIALVLLENGHDVVLWGNDASYLERLARERENAKFLPGVTLPPELRCEPDPRAAALTAQVVVSAVPTRFLRGVCGRFAGLLPRRVPILSLTKGIEVETLLRPSQVLKEFFRDHGIAVLSGPSHAEEVARRIPTSVVISARSGELAHRLQKVLNTERFRVYTNGDPLGVELGGALKNVIAIAAGVGDGLGFGDNSKAALVTRGLVEMCRLAVALGARKQTFAGLAGIGDLITTAFSRHGRNRAVGERVGQGIPLERIMRETEKVAEGILTTKAVVALARRHKVDMPISTQVHAMLFEGLDPAEALHCLMTRATKAEVW